jgi:hypothetical protein
LAGRELSAVKRLDSRNVSTSQRFRERGESEAIVSYAKGTQVAQKDKGKKKQKARVEGKTRDRDDDISRITKTMRAKEHMSYADQSHPGDEELVRHLRAPFKANVLGREVTTSV